MGPHRQADRGDLEKSTPVTRRPFADRIPNSLRNHLVAVLGEFVGTFLFLLVSNAFRVYGSLTVCRFFAFAGTQTAVCPPFQF